MKYRLIQGTLFLNDKQIKVGDMFEADNIPAAFLDSVEKVGKESRKAVQDTVVQNVEVKKEEDVINNVE